MTNPKTIRTPARRARFLEALGECAIVARAAKAGGGSRSAFYAWRHEDPDFARDWDEAVELGLWPSRTRRSAACSTAWRSRCSTRASRWRRCASSPTRC